MEQSAGDPVASLQPSATGMFEDDQTCIFIGGLRRDTTSAKMKSHICLLFKCIGMRAKKSQIMFINNRKSDYFYGFIDLQDSSAVKFVLHHLSTQPGRDNIEFDFNSIQDPLKKLKFDYKKPRRTTPCENVPVPVQKENKEENNFSLAKSFQTLPSATTSGVSTSNISMTSLPSRLLVPNKMSITTSMGGLVPNMPDRFYSYKESLGNETRTTEFKQGGFVSNDRKYLLQDNVGKYVCAFLNTCGGTLFVGVDNDGLVVGMSCDQQAEDRHRLAIDHAIKGINPPVLPNAYTVNFVPVLDENNSFSSNLKVLELKVTAPRDNGDLYVYHNDAFIRRDGSVQLLKTRDIQHWERQKQEKTEEGKEEVLQMLVERTQQVRVLQEQIDQLQQHRNDTKKSKACVII